MTHSTTVVELASLPQHLDRVAAWLVAEWPDPTLDFAARRRRLLEPVDAPATLLALAHGEPVGVLGFRRFKRQGDEHFSLFIDVLYVETPLRKRGVASALLRAAVAAAAPFDRQLFVYTHLPEWYERRGFHTRQDGVEPDRYVLRLDLPRIRDEPIERFAVRGILLTPAHEILLMRVRHAGNVFWITPGGGIDPGEEELACLRRELHEEVGLEAFSLGPLIARRRHAFRWAERRVHQSEQLYMIAVERFEPRLSDPDEAKTIDGFRWWPLEELASTQENVRPRSLAAIVELYLREGAPRLPHDIDDVPRE